MVQTGLKKYTFHSMLVYGLSAFFFLLLAFSNHILQNGLTLLAVLFCLWNIKKHSKDNEVYASKWTLLFAIAFNICVGAQFIIQFVNNQALLGMSSHIMPYKYLIIILIAILVPLSTIFVHGVVLTLPKYPFGKHFLAFYEKVLDHKSFKTIIIGLLIGAFIIRLIITPFTTSNDYLVYLDWISHYQTYGLQGLGIALGDYYIPQNILLYVMSIMPFSMQYNIAIWSWLGEYITVYYLYKIIRIYRSEDNERNHRIALLAAVSTLYLPMLLLNSSFWKQCDSIYVLFMLISLYYYLKEKPTLSFIWLGISVAFKLQGIFLIPYYIVMYVIKKRKGFWNIIWVPIMFFVAGLPAVALGQSVTDVYFRYFNQAGMYSMLTFSFPNIYGFEFTHILNNYYSILMKVALLIVTGVFVYIGITSLQKKDRFDIPTQIVFAAFVNLTCCMFLPAMHERYDYITILLLVIIVLTQNRSYMFLTCMYNIGSFVTYMTYLFHIQFAMPAISLVYCYLYVLFFYKIFYEKRVIGTNYDC